ncbi:YadA-like family protein [Sphingomonas sp. BN140010]|uniref:YadA-like family protein n=1 Tax=Sphingomonas arvum TaxID=2992113 RepID=A0ABT3JCZ4_9SPHN|nr:YadA-like family protein [Sphingomonas sp. BN140010]MCW3796932.1 YadA-like family protein [Sphingomonas sp. BN140010]
MSVGAVGAERRIVNVAAGTAANDAVNLSQLNAVSAGFSSSIASLQGDTALLFDLADRNRRDIREANEGVAMALALDTPSVPDGAKIAMSGGIGYFKNRTALATAISLAVSDKGLVSAGLGYGFRSKEVGARAGFQFAW